MPALFLYTARSMEGDFVSGSVQGESVDAILAHLKARALFVTSLQSRRSPKGALAAALRGLPVPLVARLSLFRSLATLIGAGVPLRRAFEVVIEECRNARLRESLRSVASDIEHGRALSDSMASRPSEFPPLLTAMIRAGELGGVLHDVLNRAAALLERDHLMRKRVAAALAYPAIVAVSAIALVLFLVATIVPAFATLFEEMHVAIPLSTKVLIFVGRAMCSPWSLVYIVAALALSLAGIRFARSHSVAGRYLERACLAVPLVGPLLRKAAVARMARTLGTLLRSGVALLSALRACEDVVESQGYRGALRTIADSIGQGQTISEPLAASQLFDAMFVQLIRVGEETGTLDAMLLKSAEYLEIDVESAVASLANVLEPVLIVIVGAIVGTIVGSILIPLYAVIGSIK